MGPLNGTAVIIYNMYNCALALIIDYRKIEQAVSSTGVPMDFWRIYPYTGEEICFTKSSIASLVYFNCTNSHEVALKYAKSIVGDDYTEYSKADERARN